MLYNIQWVGNNGSNFYPDRFGLKPMAIVDHISVGTMESMKNWFTDPKNNKASAHFGVGRDGTICQYVKLECGSWAQGIGKELMPEAKAPIVKDMDCDPNHYCVSIEHEGYVEQSTGEVKGLDGNLTDAQFWATCWLHKYIQSEVEKAYGVHISLGAYNVIGHFQIAPRYKPNCPGPNFPWSRLYAELAIAELMSFEDYEARVKYKSAPVTDKNRAAAVMNRVYDLWKKADNPNQYEHNAVGKLLLLEKFMKDNDLMDA